MAQKCRSAALRKTTYKIQIDPDGSNFTRQLENSFAADGKEPRKDEETLEQKCPRRFLKKPKLQNEL
jgi:hypothetical protein